LSINHNGSLDVCKKLIDIAAFSGFDYVKLQKRDIDLCVPGHKKNEPKTLWNGTQTTYYEYKRAIEFEHEEYAYIKDYCRKRNIGFFASVWDINSAEFMIKFSDIVKIPSAMITNLELLKFCRKHYDTVIMSTGMSTEEQIEKAVIACNPDVIMHTNSTYPTKVEELNFGYLRWLKEKYQDKQIGYSGHEMGLSTTYGVCGIGIDWLERHITLDHDMWGSDQKASVDPVGMIKLIRSIKDIELAMSKGYGERVIYESEKSKLKDLRK
jgi:N-acetylneuraminate synthase